MVATGQDPGFEGDNFFLLFRHDKLAAHALQSRGITGPQEALLQAIAVGGQQTRRG
jgi:hypothetical protein